MEEINSLLELERLEQAYIDKALQTEHEAECINEVKVGDLSEQVIGDMVQEMLSTIRGQRKGHRDTRRVPFPLCMNNLCGCIDDTTEEEGSSSWGTSVMDMTSEGDDYSSYRDSWSGEFSHVEIENKKSFRTGKIFSSSNKGQGSKFSKIPKWKKVLRRGEKCEC